MPQTAGQWPPGNIYEINIQELWKSNIYSCGRAIFTNCSCPCPAYGDREIEIKLGPFRGQANEAMLLTKRSFQNKLSRAVCVVGFSHRKLRIGLGKTSEGFKPATESAE